MENSTIWITGLGASTPLGNSYAEIAQNLLQGNSGVRLVDGLDSTQFPVRIAGQCAPVPIPEGIDPAEFARLSRPDKMMLWCANQALREAGCWDRRASLRIGLVFGIGAEWPQAWDRDWREGGRAVQSSQTDASAATDQVQRRLGICGPTATVAAACASANVAMAQARRWLQLGLADICLAGGFDLPVSPVGIAAFANLGALSKRNDAPAAASRPFDLDRDGFVLGEGGVLFVMERAESARRRGAMPLAEVAGYGASSDATHLVIPSSDPQPAAHAIRSALRDAGVSPDQVDYINAHATSTPVGDKFETQALNHVFGPAIKSIPLSGTKSMTGHMLSAAAAFETLACIVAIREGAIPPTINLDRPDPECSLCHVAHQAREQAVNVAVNNSFGFGGSNTSLVVRRAA